MLEEKDNDYITITTKDGNKIKAELVARFEIKDKGEYIIYEIEHEYYGAKYEIDGENTTLITDLTDEEKEVLNEVFLKMEVVE